jgi:hypothetical protein
VPAQLKKLLFLLLITVTLFFVVKVKEFKF